VRKHGNDLNTRVVRSSEPVSAAAGDALVMFSVEKGNYYGLNEIAAAIWKRIESPVAVMALCGRSAASFDVPPQRCEADVLGFSRSWRARACFGSWTRVLECEPWCDQGTFSGGDIFYAARFPSH